MGVIVLVYLNKIISLPAPLLYYVSDRSVLLHKIPNICRFYPYFSMLFQFSIAICQLFILLPVRPLNQNTTDAQRKPKKEWVGNHSGLSPGARKISGTRELPYLEVGESQQLKLCKFETQKRFSGFPLRQTVVTNVSRFLAEIKIRLFKASVQFLCTAVGFTSS